jgi:hypothetical protein
MSDSLIAYALGASVLVYLYTRRLPWLGVWTVLTYLVAYNCVLSHSRIQSMILAIAVTAGIVWHSTREFFENEKLDEQKASDPSEPEATGKSTPHVDLGTTILHAYRNLSPEQIGGMKKDTKELMELQKELMGTLAEMKPAIEQGAELLGTFSQFFGKDGAPAST